MAVYSTPMLRVLAFIMGNPLIIAACVWPSVNQSIGPVEPLWKAFYHVFCNQSERSPAFSSKPRGHEHHRNVEFIETQLISLNTHHSLGYYVKLGGFSTQNIGGFKSSPGPFNPVCSRGAVRIAETF